MRTAVALLLAIVLWTMLLLGCNKQTSVEPPLLILDTDLSSDADDVGAVAVLHRLANQGRVKILAMMVSSGDQWSAPCLEALNAWFGRPEILVGRAQDGAVQDESKYTRAIAEAFSRHPIETPDAVQLYRRLLAAQADQSVTIVTIGYLTNLAQLLRSAPDEISPLNGTELVHQKAERLVCMGGQYPAGREWNFHRDSVAAAFVINHWPGQIIFTGFELGKDILTGAALRSLPKANPVRWSYELHNELKGRPSWDQIAVYYAVMTAKGEKSDLWSKKYGRNTVRKDGSNHWLNTQETTDHAYLVQRGKDLEITTLLEQLMLTATP